MNTLATNKHRVKGALKEVEMRSEGYYITGVGIYECEEAQGNGKAVGDGAGNIIETAVILVVDPRSLAEIMSVVTSLYPPSAHHDPTWFELLCVLSNERRI